MGATIGAGSDIGGTASGFFGRFTDELKHYANAGISNFDILQMATSIFPVILWFPFFEKVIILPTQE